MKDGKFEQLIQEYQANVELWKHDDNLRQQRNSTFLSMNTIMLVALGTFLNIAPNITNAAISGFLISLFGLPICLMWNTVQERNSEYIRFRRFMLRSLETQLTSLSTFTKQWNALNKFESVQFEGLKDTFTAKRGSRISSTFVEGKLPLVVIIFWSFVFILSTIFLLLLSTGKI